MDDVLQQMIMIIGSYLGVIIIGFALINFLTAGFLIKFIRVRASRGKLILIKVKSTTDQYYRTGMISERTLIYKARGQKENKRVSIPEGAGVYRAMNIWCMDCDEETNEIILPSGKKVDTYDAEKYEQLIIRALYKPALMDKNEKIILIMLAVVILGLGITFMYVKNVDDKVFFMLEQLRTIKDVATQSVGVVG